ncbi:class I adenylate-forming enzyme family protein [Novosphingobium sp.]|uniref:class I adenylate-forming enzyme family protein n=1 Tax=Novosphingobium sp. TaxID=1874826 RepID=UPI00286E53FD|nr:class I adenylate-forming enzyme family protein [Novosphingobium sp.]
MGEDGLSVVYGGPLDSEPLMGALTIGGYLRDVAARYGGAEALAFYDDGQRVSWTYDDLLARSMGLAKALIASDLEPGARVGILMSNRPDFLVALFGTALVGCVPVALSTFSTESELDYLLTASQVELVVYEARVAGKDFAAILGQAPDAGRWPDLREAVALGASFAEFVARGDGVNDTRVRSRVDAVSPEDIGGIFFSSGTTSLPKGIVHSHKDFAIQWWRWPRVFAMREPVRSWTGNGFFWSGNVSMIVGTAFSSGGAVVLQPWFEEEEALRLIGAERVTFLAGRSHQWARLEAAKGWADADLSSLRYVTRGEILKRHPAARFDWEEPMSFGTTETMTICTSFGRDVSSEHYQGSCGPPLPGNWLKIVEPLTGAPVPVGERGEMCIKGPTLMMTYLGKTPDQCLDRDGYYCTGDGGYVDAVGRFFWEGRLTDMIKTGGANVAPEEVDAAIARFPGVKRTQTVGVPDDLLGELVVSCLVPVKGCAIDEAELIAFLKRDLASFKLPRRILVFTDEDFAVTGSGKAKASDIRGIAAARLKG